MQHAFESAQGEPGPGRPEVTVLSVSRSGARLEVEVRYRAGREYCCAESVCHLPLYCKRWWARFRESIREASEREPPPVSVVVYGVVEDGALLATMPSLGISARSKAYSYRAGVEREKDAR